MHAQDPCSGAFCVVVGAQGDNPAREPTMFHSVLCDSYSLIYKEAKW